MNTALHKLFDVVDHAGLNQNDFVEDALVLLAMAIDCLPESTREAALRKIESGGLRGAVEEFEARRQPKAHNVFPRLQ
jgi:hypothetical protein